uniref:UBA domain-containing protein n=1 Tax=Craspedostauros australis TaxID=1486917 RepID=A0A7R9WP76_9STRA|mmetsp:Transcript_11150/g.30832  ORF Transcript_11150/g.30832 Transcript_11150/m.30832 type:complete len:316 (+) Transcript_11150:222-1169(+)
MAPASSSSSSYQQAWFLGAPATKVSMLILLFLNVLSHSSGGTSSGSGHIASTMHRSFHGFRWSDFLTSKFLYASTAQFITGVLCMATHLRRLEREFGSEKFVVFLGFVTAFTICMEVLGLVVLDIVPPRYNGAFSWLGAALFMMERYTPRMNPNFVSVLGFAFSEKILSYIFSIYIICSGGMTTIVPAAMGAAGAAAFVTLPSFRLPSFVTKLGANLFSFVTDDPPSVYAPLVQNHVGGRNRTATDAFGMAVNNNNNNNNIAHRRRPAAPIAPVGPSEDAIQQLTSMGFSRENVVRALERSGNSVERAADQLLSQ